MIRGRFKRGPAQYSAPTLGSSTPAAIPGDPRLPGSEDVRAKLLHLVQYRSTRGREWIDYDIVVNINYAASHLRLMLTKRSNPSSRARHCHGTI